MEKEILIFVKSDKEFELPKKCEGLFYPLKFDPTEYLKWKNENDLGIRDEFLVKTYDTEASLYKEVYSSIFRNFITAADKEFMLYTEFLVDPRKLEGRLDYTNISQSDYDPDWEPEMVYDVMRDSEARFSGDFKDLYSKFITLLRHCVVLNPVAPDYVVEAIGIPRSTLNNSGEYSITLDSISKDSWKVLSRWATVRNFISNCKELFPTIEKLLEIYGEPSCASLSSQFMTMKDSYVDVVDSEDSGVVVSGLIENYGVENVKYYELPN
jgi:hypothetical protein